MAVKCYVSFCSRAIHFLIHLRLYTLVVMIMNNILLCCQYVWNFDHLCRISKLLLLRMVDSKSLVLHFDIIVKSLLTRIWRFITPVTFSCLLNSFFLLTVHCPSFALFIYNFFLIICFVQIQFIVINNYHFDPHFPFTVRYPNSWSSTWYSLHLKMLLHFWE